MLYIDLKIDFILVQYFILRCKFSKKLMCLVKKRLYSTSCRFSVKRITLKCSNRNISKMFSFNFQLPGRCNTYDTYKLRETC